jgi:hypothetical protein
MSNLSDFIPLLVEKSINNQAMLTVILKEIAILKSNNSNKSKETILNELMIEVNKERDKLSNDLN